MAIERYVIQGLELRDSLVDCHTIATLPTLCVCVRECGHTNTCTPTDESAIY